MRSDPANAAERLRGARLNSLICIEMTAAKKHRLVRVGTATEEGRPTAPKFVTRTSYSAEFIEQQTGFKPTTTTDGIAATDALGDYTQYDFQRRGSRFFLVAIDGEEVW